MANKLYEESSVQAIADAIRSKNGSNTKYEISEMAKAIEDISGIDTGVIEFSQMNDVVTAYLTDADAKYTDSNGGSVSVVADYATATGDKDRPLGLDITTQNGTRYLQNETSGNGSKITNIIGSKATIFNAIPNQISQYIVKDSNGNVLDNGRIKPTGKVRMIKFCGYPRNCRDLGGWTCDGGTVKYGKLYRSSAIGDVDSTLISIVRELGIHHEIDLREGEEFTDNSLASIVHFHHCPLALYFADVINPTKGDYESIKNILRTIFTAVSKNEAVLYHCAIGRDRTGTVSALILSILGVAIKDIDKDFELSSFSSLNTPCNRTSSSYRALIDYLKSYNKSTLMAGAITWCLKAGFSIDEINAFRKAMCNGTPTVLKVEDYITTYTVTQTLSNCTSDNAQSSVAEGEPLTLTISPNANYEMSSITVTMGGTNITSSAVSGNTINIANVTGNVVITASATEMVLFTNVLPLSINSDKTLFASGKGWKTGYRLSDGDGDERPLSGYEVSGFIPVTYNDVFRIKNFTNGATSYDNICFYDSSFAFVKPFTGSSSYNPLSQFIKDDGTMEGSLSTISKTNATTAQLQSIAYMRLSLKDITANTIVIIEKVE